MKHFLIFIVEKIEEKANKCFDYEEFEKIMLDIISTDTETGCQKYGLNYDELAKEYITQLRKGVI